MISSRSRGMHERRLTSLPHHCSGHSATPPSRRPTRRRSRGRARRRRLVSHHRISAAHRQEDQAARQRVDQQDPGHRHADALVQVGERGDEAVLRRAHARPTCCRPSTRPAPRWLGPPKLNVQRSGCISGRSPRCRPSPPLFRPRHRPRASRRACCWPAASSFSALLQPGRHRVRRRPARDRARRAGRSSAAATGNSSLSVAR